MPLGTEIGLWPVDIVLYGDPAPPRKGAQHPRPPHTFRATSIVAKRSPISATAERLFQCDTFVIKLTFIKQERNVYRHDLECIPSYRNLCENVIV